MADKAEQVRKLRRAINKFEAAVRAHEISGAQPPEDRPLIEAEYLVAKQKLEDVIQALI